MKNLLDPQPILLVDDRRENLMTLEKILLSDSHQIDTAGSGEEALKKCLQNNYDLLILDVQMKDMDGFELATILKGSKKTKDIPIIFVSAKYQEDYHVKTGFETGAVDYIFMPFKKDLIKLKVNAFLKLRYQQKELEALTENLEYKNKELTQFSYMVSHDLKGPLRGINNLVQWINEDIEGQAPKIKEYIDLTFAKVKHMDNLIAGLLDYSKAGTQSLAKETVSFKEIISVALRGLVIPDNFQIEYAEDLPDLDCFSLLMQQVTANLIQNSIKHNDKEKGHLLIHWEDKGDKFHFIFTDNGPGIPENMTEKVFEIFQTGKSGQENQNSGVGLAIVKKLMGKMGGTIWIDSDYSQGARFILSVPKRKKGDL